MRARVENINALNQDRFSIKRESSKRNDLPICSTTSEDSGD